MPLHSTPYTAALPPYCHLSPLEPHWNLIGTSLEPHRRTTERRPRDLRRKIERQPILCNDNGAKNDKTERRPGDSNTNKKRKKETKEMQQKYVIADSARGEFGKTTVLNHVIDLLQNKQYSYRLLINGTDRKIIFDINGCKVGIETQGDPNSRMPDSMDDFVRQQCDIILTACRSYGETLDKVYSLQQYGYIVMIAQNIYSDDKSITSKLNGYYANNIIQIIENMTLGNF